MGDFVRPGDLAGLKDDLTKAVINAYMAKKVPELTGLQWDHGSCEDGEFRYKEPADWSIDKGFYCSYPGGHWQRDDNWAPDPDVEAGPIPYSEKEVVLPDAAAIYSMIEEEVATWVDPWVDGHSPNEFANQMNSLGTVAAQLYVDGGVVTTEVTGSGGSSTHGTLSPVTDIQTCIDDTRSDLAHLSSVAVRALEHAYTNDVGRTITGQRNLAVVATLAITGEAIAWSQTYADLKTFFTQATADFNSYAQSSGGYSSSAPQKLGAFAAVAGTVAGATAEIPPVAIAAAVVAGIAGVAAAFWPEDEAARPAVLIALEGGDFDAVWTSFTEGVRAIDTELTDTERCLGVMCNNAIEDMVNNPDNYSITRRLPNGQPQPNDPLGQYLHSEIDIGHGILKQVAGRIEAIGDHQYAVAKRLGGSDGGGNPSALVSSEWTRGTLNGVVIGWGYNGHYSNYEAVVNELIDLLRMEARTAHTVAEHTYAVATDFQITDHHSKVVLDGHLQRLADGYDTVSNAPWEDSSV